MFVPQLALRVAFATALLALPGKSDGPTRDAVYERTLARALDQAQAALLAATELGVDHTTWDDPWRVRSEHYEVVTTKSRLEGMAMAASLETMLGHFSEVLDFDVSEDDPFLILVHTDAEGYNAFGGDADEHSSFYPSFYAANQDGRPVASFGTANQTTQFMWLTHSATHQFVDAVTAEQPGAVPTWVNEGLASYFALYWSYPWAVSELKTVFTSNQFVPLAELLSDNLADFLNRTHARTIELGMLFNYLMLFREETRIVRDEDDVIVRAPFRDYLRGRMRGEDITRNPVHALLTRQLDQLERDFRAFKGWE